MGIQKKPPLGSLVPSDKIREFFSYLVKRCNCTLEQIADQIRLSDETRKENERTDTYDRIISAETKNTHEIPGTPIAFFELALREHLDGEDDQLALLSFLLVELLGDAHRRRSRYELVSLLVIAETIYDRERDKAEGTPKALLDYLQGYASLLRVEHELPRVTERSDIPLNDEEIAAARENRLLEAEGLLAAAIEFLHKLDPKDHPYADFFLVRGYENYLWVADERGDNQAELAADWLLSLGAKEAILANARETKRPLVAFNAAELCGRGRDQDGVKEAFLLYFELIPPTEDENGKVAVAGQYPEEISYLADGFKNALRKWREDHEST